MYMIGISIRCKLFPFSFFECVLDFRCLVTELHLDPNRWIVYTMLIEPPVKAEDSSMYIYYM